MSADDQRFDFRNLLAAALDSCRFLAPLLRDLSETAPVAIKLRFLAGQLLPALDDDVAVFWVELDAVTKALIQFRCGERRSTSKERVIHGLSPPKVIRYRAPHQFDGLLGRMIILRFIRATHYEFRAWGIPDGRVLARLAKPRRIFLADEPAGLMLEPIQCPREHGPTFVLNDLLVVNKADP
jgi:hypothetical protein